MNKTEFHQKMAKSVLRQTQKLDQFSRYPAEGDKITVTPSHQGYTTTNGKEAKNMERKIAKKIWLRYLPMVIFTVIGTAGGYLYYHFIGCASGTCAITSNPYISAVYGGVLGLLTGAIITPIKKRQHKERNHQ